MDHESYERNMFNSINQHAADAQKNPSYSARKALGRVVVRGLKRTLLALLTVGTFAIAVISLIGVATAPGYLAVLLFFLALLELLCSYILLYAQGIIHNRMLESKGENTHG